MIPKILRGYNSYKHTYTCDILISRFRFSIKFLYQKNAENDSESNSSYLKYIIEYTMRSLCLIIQHLLTNIWITLNLDLQQCYFSSFSLSICTRLRILYSSQDTVRYYSFIHVSLQAFLWLSYGHFHYSTSASDLSSYKLICGCRSYSLSEYVYAQELTRQVLNGLLLLSSAQYTL